MSDFRRIFIAYTPACIQRGGGVRDRWYEREGTETDARTGYGRGREDRLWEGKEALPVSFLTNFTSPNEGSGRERQRERERERRPTYRLCLSS
jgi:hypothetical protein